MALEKFRMQKTLSVGYDEALARVPDALKTEGFGVLTEIDVKDTLKKKLGVEFRRYRILGACNPTFAHKALSTEIEVGVLLPCNVVVYEDDAGKAVVMAIDPMQSIAASGNQALGEVALAVRTKLQAVLAKLE
jgi:uncharacterized protein (DUF302 family)